MILLIIFILIGITMFSIAKFVPILCEIYDEDYHYKNNKAELNKKGLHYSACSVVSLTLALILSAVHPLF